MYGRWLLSWPNQPESTLRLLRSIMVLEFFESRKKRPKLVDMAEELKEKEFEYFYKNIGKLPLVEWQDFVKWLG